MSHAPYQQSTTPPTSSTPAGQPSSQATTFDLAATTAITRDSSSTVTDAVMNRHDDDLGMHEHQQWRRHPSETEVSSSAAREGFVVGKSPRGAGLGPRQHTSFPALAISPIKLQAKTSPSSSTPPPARDTLRIPRMDTIELGKASDLLAPPPSPSPSPLSNYDGDSITNSSPAPSMRSGASRSPLPPMPTDMDPLSPNSSNPYALAAEDNTFLSPSYSIEGRPSLGSLEGSTLAVSPHERRQSWASLPYLLPGDSDSILSATTHPTRLIIPSSSSSPTPSASALTPVSPTLSNTPSKFSWYKLAMLSPPKERFQDFGIPIKKASRTAPAALSYSASCERKSMMKGRWFKWASKSSKSEIKVLFEDGRVMGQPALQEEIAEEVEEVEEGIVQREASLDLLPVSPLTQEQNLSVNSGSTNLDAVSTITATALPEPNWMDSNLDEETMLELAIAVSLEDQAREERRLAPLEDTEMSEESSPPAPKKDAKGKGKVREAITSFFHSAASSSSSVVPPSFYTVFGGAPPQIIVTPPQKDSSNSTRLIATLDDLPSEVWVKVSCYLSDPNVFSRTCRRMQSLLEGDNNLAFRRDWLFHQYGAHLALYYAYARHYKSPARIRREEEDAEKERLWRKSRVKDSQVWMVRAPNFTPLNKDSKEDKDKDRCRKKIKGCLLDLELATLMVRYGAGLPRFFLQKLCRDVGRDASRLPLVELLIREYSARENDPRFVWRRPAPLVPVNKPKRRVIAGLSLAVSQPMPTPGSTSEVPLPPQPTQSPAIAIPSWATSSKAIVMALGGTPPATVEGWKVSITGEDEDSDVEKEVEVEVIGKIDTSAEIKERQRSQRMWRDLFAKDDTTTFERLANCMSSKTVNHEEMERIKTLMIRRGFVPVPELTPTAAFRVYQMSRIDMGLLDLLMEKNCMRVDGDVNDQVLTWVVQGHEGGRDGDVAVLDDDVDDVDDRDLSSLDPQVMSRRIVMVPQDPTNLLKVYLKRGFRVTAPVVTSILRNYGSSSQSPTLPRANPSPSTSPASGPSPSKSNSSEHQHQRNLDLLFAVSNLSRPRNLLLTCAIDLVNGMMGPSGADFSERTLDWLMSMGVLTETHIRKALLLPAVVERTFVGGRVSADGGNRWGADVVPGLPYNTRCYEQNGPYRVWKWVLKTFGPNHVMTRMCFDGEPTGVWLADLATRLQTHRPPKSFASTSSIRSTGSGSSLHIYTPSGGSSNENLFSLPLDFMDEGCRVKPQHLTHLARMAQCPKSRPFPSLILYRVRRWASIPGGMRDDERKAWLDALRRNVVGGSKTEYARSLTRADAVPRDEPGVSMRRFSGSMPGVRIDGTLLGSGFAMLSGTGRERTRRESSPNPAPAGVNATSSLRGLSPNLHGVSSLSPHNQAAAAAASGRKMSMDGTRMSRSPSRPKAGGILASILPEDPVITYKKSSSSSGSGASLPVGAAGASSVAGLGISGMVPEISLDPTHPAPLPSASVLEQLPETFYPQGLLSSKPSRFLNEASELFKILSSGGALDEKRGLR
ncbi:hypothetical protein HDU97_008047 [Phlyctochytrium planicorne]|nr:hypothetical protein HDU97_008047 [Phlyctochytrium planicorne]